MTPAPCKNFRFLGALLPPLFFLFSAGVFLNAQEGVASPSAPTQPITQPLRDRAVVLRIVTRVIEKDDTEAWNSDSYKIAIPGRPIGLKIVGENVAVSVQFTLYRHRNLGGILVAQGQIFTEMPEGGLQCRTMMQVVPFDFGEQVFFFPLGPGNPDDAHIEIQIEMNPYDETVVNNGTDEIPPVSHKTDQN